MPYTSTNNYTQHIFVYSPNVKASSEKYGRNLYQSLFDFDLIQNKIEV